MKNQFEPNNTGASGEQQDSYLANQVGAQIDSDLPQNLNRRKMQSNQNNQAATKHEKNNIFQQFIAPATTQTQTSASVTQQQKSSPKAMHFQNSMQMHKNLSSIGKNLVMQHKNQYNTTQPQANNHAAIDFERKQIDNTAAPISQGDIHGGPKTQLISFEESREQFYGSKVATTHVTAPEVHGSGEMLSNEPVGKMQKNNNLNQGLLGLQPQTSKRGQRRHFPTKNGIDILRGNNLPGSNTKPTENPGDSNRSQASNTGGRFMRAPFISGKNYQIGGGTNSNATVVTGVAQTSTNAPGVSATEASEQSGSSIFQKNRLNLQIQKQTNSYNKGTTSSGNQESKDGEQNKTGYGQFKFPQSALPQHGTHVLGQYGASVMRTSPKNQGRSRLGQFKNNQSDEANQTFSPQPKTPGQDKAKQLIRKTQTKHMELLRDREWKESNMIFGKGYQTKQEQLNHSTISNQHDTSMSSQVSGAGGRVSLKHSKLSHKKLPESSNKKRNLKTSADKADPTKGSPLGGEKQHFSAKKTPTSVPQKNYRKYKKQLPLKEPGDPDEFNVLGQPRTQYGPEDFQRKRIGTGLFNNTNISMRGTILPKNINFPSMVGSEKTTTVAGGQSLNITNIGSFQNDAVQKPTGYFGRKNKHSIFSNFSGTENIIQDINYTQKGSTDNQRIAWEIKFNNNQINKDEVESEDNVIQDLQKKRQTFKYRQEQQTIEDFNQTLNSVSVQGESIKSKIKIKLQKLPKKQVAVHKIQTLTPTKATAKAIIAGESSGATHFRRQKKPTGPASSQKETSTFKKGARAQKMIKQSQGMLPAELIVTGYLNQKLLGASNPTETMEDKSLMYNTPQKSSPFPGEKTDFLNQDISKVDDDYDDDDFFRATSEAEFDEYMEENKMESEFDVRPSINPESLQEDSIVQESELGQKSVAKEITDDIQIQIQPKKSKPVVNKLNLKFNSSDSQVKVKSSQTSRISKPAVNFSSGSQIKSCINLPPPSKGDLILLSSQSELDNKIIQSAAGKMQNSKIQKLKQRGWSGGVSDKTQMKFQQAVNENRSIKDKLNMLRHKGSLNESSSLFKALVADIKKATNNSITDSEIVNCIKASSMGAQSAFEPRDLPKIENSKKTHSVVKKSKSLISINRRKVVDTIQSRQSLLLPSISQQRQPFSTKSVKTARGQPTFAFSSGGYIQPPIKSERLGVIGINPSKQSPPIGLAIKMSDQNSAPTESIQLIKNNFISQTNSQYLRQIQIGHPLNRNLQYVDSEIQLEKMIRPGEPGNMKIKPSGFSEMNKKMNDKKKEIAQKSSNDKNSGSGSMRISSQNSYSAKYQKQNQVKTYVKAVFNNQIQFGQIALQEKEPVEYGQIIKWRQGEIVGLGSSSIVYSAIRVDKNTLLAVKKFKVVSDISGIDQQKLKIIKNEISKYKQLNHENIVKFFGCELLDQFFCIYLEQMETSLANVLSEYGYFDEITIRYYTKQILKGLQYLHEQKIKHLDLKCSNILTNNDGIIKLCDFGSSREFKLGSNNISSSFTSMKSQILGSVQWMAPEVIKEEGSGSKSDIWSLGCTIVEMFVGGNPWGDKIDDQNLFLAQKTIVNSDILPQIPKSIKVSMDCEDFLAKCLMRDYNHRPSASELLNHPWIQKDDE